MNTTIEDNTLGEVTPKIEELVQEAFEMLEFNDGIEIVDKLRDIEFEEFTEEGNAHYIATSFANDQGEEDEQADSFRVSVHCEISPDLRTSHAYAYDCRTGNEIATFVRPEQSVGQDH